MRRKGSKLPTDAHTIGHSHINEEARVNRIRESQDKPLTEEEYESFKKEFGFDMREFRE